MSPIFTNLSKSKHAVIFWNVGNANHVGRYGVFFWSQRLHIVFLFLIRHCAHRHPLTMHPQTGSTFPHTQWSTFHHTLKSTFHPCRTRSIRSITRCIMFIQMWYVILQKRSSLLCPTFTMCYTLISSPQASILTTYFLLAGTTTMIADAN